MTPEVLRFDRFLLDPADRRLTCDGAPIELSPRYLDALTLLVAADGALVTKDRFLAEAWRGVPVTDEALTQCIRTLRRLLGDDAANPRFIATVPKHGYRFLPAVERLEAGTASPAAPALPARSNLHQSAMLWAAGGVGGAAAGAAGGIVYGFTFDAQPSYAGAGAASVLIVLLVVCALVGAVAGGGVGGGIAVAQQLSGRLWNWATLGGAIGGMLVGAIVKLLGSDAFDLLLGHPPGDIAGGAEGLVLGAAVGLGGYVGHRRNLPLTSRIGVAGLGGGVAGIVIGMADGRLMGGSLDALARGFTDSRLRMDQLGTLFGEAGFGPITNTVTAGLEGALFAGCVVTAIAFLTSDPPI